MSNLLVLFIIPLSIFIGIESSFGCTQSHIYITNNHCKKETSSSHCKSESKETNAKQSDCCNLICCKNFVFIQVLNNKPKDKECNISLVSLLIHQKTYKKVRNFNSDYFHPPDFIQFS